MFIFLLLSSKNPSQKKKPRKSYPVDYKLKVLDYSRGKNNCETALHFNIDESLVRRWKKNQQKLRDLAKNTQDFRTNKAGNHIVKKKFRLLGAGRKIVDTERDDDVMAWIVDKRSRQMPVSGEEIKRKAKQIAEQRGDTTFKVHMYTNYIIFEHCKQKLKKKMLFKIYLLYFFKLYTRIWSAFPIFHYGFNY